MIYPKEHTMKKYLALLALLTVAACQVDPAEQALKQQARCRELNNWSEYFQACVASEGRCVLVLEDLAAYDARKKEYLASCLTPEQKLQLLQPKPKVEPIKHQGETTANLK